MGCACLFALLALGGPRLAFLGVWLLTPWVNQAFNTFIWPLLGLVFLPVTTLMYVLVYNPVTGVSAWGWGWIILAVFLDLASYGGSGYSNRDRLPVTGRSY